MRIEYARPQSQGVTSAMAVGEDDLRTSTQALSQEMMKPWRLLLTAAAAYHGYRRNRSVGWAIGWAVAGSFAPLITVGVALAQGFGKRK